SGPLAVGLFAETYMVTITDNVGCTMINSFTLDAPPAINAQVDFIDPNCDGLETGIVQINSISGGTPTYQYSLNNSSFQELDLFEGLPEGVYEFTIMDENGCILTDQSEIFAPQIPEILTLEDLTVALGCEVVINPEVNISEFNNITWVDASTLDCDNCLTPSASPFNTSTYTLFVTSVDDCTTEGSLRVFVEKDRAVYIPNVFSPNDDGINDRFTVHAGKQVEMISSLSIYDRWGELVFNQENLSPNDTNQGWDGRFKNRKAINGIYSYIAVIEYLDGETLPIAGDVLISR
ncbi:gliding motility-associated C-terminal domain-containing protein, partial [Saprospiraceae bacterium]|nr:gliding motility-associated C-terminal domain-containing protein [Saprospiraceae bacterium]